MPEAIRFRNAPLTEALLDIRVKLPSEINLQILARFQDIIRDRFPERKERIVFRGQLQIKSGSTPELLSPSSGPLGYLFNSADGKKLVQARLDGFTFNKLKPYESWNALRDEAKDLWNHYLDIAKPKSITRVALRYINRIEMPLPIRDFKDYILTVPEVAPEMPQELENFLMRLTVPDTKTRATAIVTETIDKISEGQETLPLIFDIDVMMSIVADPKSNEIWALFEDLHDFKNRIFFQSITDKAKELFK